MTENKMPDEIWACVDHGYNHWIDTKPVVACSELYHHDRIVQGLKLREAKLVEALEDMIDCAGCTEPNGYGNRRDLPNLRDAKIKAIKLINQTRRKR
jgi:hypothetical protein